MFARELHGSWGFIFIHLTELPGQLAQVTRRLILQFLLPDLHGIDSKPTILWLKLRQTASSVVADLPEFVVAQIPPVVFLNAIHSA